MSRVLLEQWCLPALAPGEVVERQDGREGWLDRWLAGWAASGASWRSRWTCWRLQLLVQRIVSHESALQALDEAGLDARIDTLRRRLRAEGLAAEPVCEAFAVVREVSRRLLGKAHYTAQLTGGLVLLRGHLAEMQTGEGKTLTALLPVVTTALAGAPVHVITVNDYLAARDAELMQPVYRRFGLDVGTVCGEQSPAERAAAWSCAVVYTTNKDLVFDYLRDRLGSGDARLHSAVRALVGSASATARQLRGLYFALIDEADSVLVDEARTPLILSAERSDGQDRDDWVRVLDCAREMQEGVHFSVRLRERQIEITPAGEARIDERHADAGGLLTARRARMAMTQQALSALHLYLRDRHYIVSEGKVIIVDESTGRPMPDRSWDRGLHQMIELKEGCELTAGRDTLARITYQRFFRRYLRLAGMTGTATEVAAELRAIYGLGVVRVPTHRPVLRRNLGLRLYRDANARWQAVAERAREFSQAGRSVLIGTRSVGASEAISHTLRAVGLEHQLLNARQDAEEAAIIADAGLPGRITVATNMAGRGTDILLHPDVKAAGGLHVILTEYHDSARVDRQLFGRTGRQGDPGSFEALVSLDDELFAAFGGPLWRLLRAGWLSGGAQVAAPLAHWLRRSAQARAERYFSAVRQRTVDSDRSRDRQLAFGERAS